jgi:dephospho-CoA kinase
VPSIGLTGPAGSGKSEALAILETLGAKVLAADRVGHQLLEDPGIRQQVVGLLGDAVLNREGHLDRPAIREKVFSNRSLLESYNAILHPPLLKVLKEWLIQQNHPDQVVVIEAALLPEWEIEDWFDEVWCLRCPETVIRQRWQGSEEQLEWIKQAQFTPAGKQAKATRMIDNENEKNHLRRRIETEFAGFKKRHGGRL